MTPTVKCEVCGGVGLVLARVVSPTEFESADCLACDGTGILQATDVAP